jgi:DNA replication protein DnaC
MIESIYRKRRHRDAFEDEVLATALLDRLLHHAEVMTTKAISMMINQSLLQ